MSWTQLNEMYQRKGLFMALGAGVSVDSELPTWRGLLLRVAERQDAAGGAALVEALDTHRLPLPTIASVLEQRAPDRQAFIEEVRAALYRDLPYWPDGVGKSNRRRFVRQLQARNPTLRAVASLCAVPAGTGGTYAANPRIHAIVTFNLDAMLQAYIYARYTKRLVRTVERPSASRRPGKINLYHMHGFLRFDEKAGDRAKEAADACVLTEQDYYDVFNEPTSLFNYTFLYLLREFSCLFIGLSMTDDNIRRLLHYSTRERRRAYDREGQTSVPETKIVRHFALLKSSGQVAVDRAMERTLHRLGTRVLWVEAFSDVPDRLQAMYESTGNSWEAVYA